MISTNILWRPRTWSSLLGTQCSGSRKAEPPYSARTGLTACSSANTTVESDERDDPTPIRPHGD
jgi:hypothetical protein